MIAAFKEQQRQYQTVLEGMKVQQSGWQCGPCIGQPCPDLLLLQLPAGPLSA